ncbi:FAD-dependent oxidoreductase [Geobacter sulfurreducens subsp. ethanolicus]|uniref:FAD-dependent oxidoreductase n=1 Tax=Geomobilimonas luticola TaxID=1114878 RepID=A0ABS5SAY8_9BACT|nr:MULTISPECIES: FAD-dependent oxidoreductase [Geobacteraceae]MBT0652530.1 FAD-dependent oxidoreductase [Geomobilimonas luticola]BEH08963.1 FAD-dependent oxidoreductase [Geobacter sulfurreducens subsp. ethanolicus]
MKTVIIGGIAGGLSAASQIKREDHGAQVVVLEKSGDVSYAACGMPYNLFYKDKPVEDLYAMSLEAIRKERGIDYRLHNEVVTIDPLRKEVTVVDHQLSREYRESYDYLVYATGNQPNRLTLPGFDDADVFYFKTLDDTRLVKSIIYEKSPSNVILIGSGYTNLELVDVLYNMKIKPVILEKSATILPSFAEEIRAKVLEKLEEKGIKLHTNVDITEKQGSVVRTTTRDFEAGMVVVSIGVRPNTALFSSAGGELGVGGAVKVDRFLRTNLPDVFAAGDCAEHYVRQLGRNGYMPLGPVANKQGRLAGSNIVNSNAMKEFYGIDQTAVFKFFDLTVATSGLSERQLQENGANYVKVYVDTSTRGAFPGGGTMRVLLLFEEGTGLLLGGQMIGQDVVAKRLDVLATGIYKQMTVFELAELDLSYSPLYSPVWDPLLIAANKAIKYV